MRLPLVVVCLLAAVPAGARAALTPGDYAREMPFGGLLRNYILHVPPFPR
jgi:hypothetical protein